MSLQSQLERAECRIADLELQLEAYLGTEKSEGRIYLTPEMRLTPSEARIYRRLQQSPGECVSHDALYEALYWDKPNPASDPKIVAVIICHLRAKLHKADGTTLTNVWGDGYLLGPLKPCPLRAALIECEEYFDDRADAESFADGAVIVNEEIRMLGIVQEALGK